MGVYAADEYSSILDVKKVCGWRVSLMLQLTMRLIVFRTVGLGLFTALTFLTSSCYSAGTPNIKVQFVNPRVGFIVGGRLWRTEDGGASWSVVRSGGFGTFKAEYVGYGHRAIQFVDPQFGVQLGPGLIAMTVDGGQTWSDQHPLPEPVNRQIAPQTVLFISRELGWVVGEFIYKTTDGARSWQVLSKMPLGDSQSEQDPKLGTYTDFMPSLWFMDSNHGVMARVDGKIYLTDDGGVTWEKVFTSGKTIRDLIFLDDNSGWIVGSEGFMARTDDAGRTWKTVQSQSDVTLNSISFAGKLIGCVAGESATILCTNDGGITWRKSSINGLSTPTPLGSISLRDETHAWAVGGNSDPIKPSATAPSSLVIRSDDGGRNWYVVPL